MEIRPFRESDHDRVVALWTDVFDPLAPHNDPATAIQRKLAVQRELFLVAVVDGAVAGTAMGGYDGHRGWVYSLAVLPELRRRGIGSALMKHIEQALAARRCLKINLQVLASNAATVGFYQSLGYRVEQRISMGKLV